MKTFAVILLLIISSLGFSQNLVMNPSFEDYYECPTGFSQIKKCKNVFNPWCTAGGSTQNCFVHQSNYFNGCADISTGLNVPHICNTISNNNNIVYSYREAKDGNAFISIRNDILINPVTWQTQGSVREYVQIKLTTPLIAGKKYDFSFYAGSADNSAIWKIQINQLGVHFTNDSILYSNTSMPIWKLLDADWVSNEYITDSIGWQKLSGSYLANGGEKWMIVGIFTTSEEFSYNQIHYNGLPNEDKYSTTYLDDFYMEEKLDSLPIPTITILPATCNEQGSATISNYDSSNTYTFSPPGPTVDNNGNISGMLPGTCYTVTSNDGTNDSDPSDAFTIEAQIPAVSAPTVTSPQSFCGATLTSDLVPSTSEYNWYSTIGGETLLNPNDTLYSGTYYVSHLNGNCESEKAVVEVIIHPNPNLTVSPNVSICEGETVLLTVMGADSYVWSPTNENGNSLSVSPTSTTTYTVIGTTNEGCSDTVSVTVTVVKPVASFSASTDLGSIPFDVHFTNTSSSATSYNWSVDSVYQSSNNQFTYHFETEGSYVITLIASNGACSDTISKTIKAIYIPASPVDIPNVFSPNADNVNDLWTVNAQLKNIIILNRWGNVVYSAGAEFNGWDGTSTNATPVKDGVYFYKIEDLNGKIHTGFITLFR